MLDKLIDFLIKFITLFRIFVFVDEFEKGVILRQGRFHRVVGPGLRWVRPLAQDEVLTVNVKPEPMHLDIQSLHTADGYNCNIQIGIIWRVTDVKEFLIENEDTDNIVGILCSGVVSESVQKSKWTDIADSGYATSLKAPMNRKVRKRGAEIDEVIVQDFVSGRADRIWHEGITFSLGSED